MLGPLRRPFRGKTADIVLVLLISLIAVLRGSIFGALRGSWKLGF